MRDIFRQNQFKKDVKKIKKSGRYRLRNLFVMQEDKYRQEGEFKEGRMLFDIGPCQFELDFGKIFETFQ
jgi:hypothetical protein